MGMLFGVNPFVEVLQRSKVDVLVFYFLEQAAQWFLPNAFCIHITMEMGCCISLILDGATNGADEPQNPTSGMCAVNLVDLDNHNLGNESTFGCRAAAQK